MAKTCPKCGLYSPDEALRCDCGYDFGSGRMEKSYVAEDLVRRHGGVSQLLRATSKPEIVTGSVLIGGGVLMAIGFKLAGGLSRVPWVAIIIGVVKLARGIQLRLRASRPVADDQQRPWT